MTNPELRAQIRSARVRPWRYLLRRLLRPSVIDIGGVRLKVDSSRTPFALRKAIYHADFEAKERLIAGGVLSPGDRVLEGGAGMGLVTITAAKIVGPGNVTCYEPTPSMFSLLEDNVSLNSVAVDCRNRALGPKSGTMKFHVRSNLISSGAAGGGNNDPIEVRVDGIAEALAETGANALILDVEGEEIKIIEACPLDRLDRIILEIHPRVVGDGPTTQMIARIIAAGFVWRHDLSYEAALTFLRNDAPRPL